MLDKPTLHKATQTLAQKDPKLAAVVEKHGTPPLWDRAPGFPALVKIILEQQVSLASAQACYDKLLETINPLTPYKFLTLSDTELKQIGYSRQKTRYTRILVLGLFVPVFVLPCVVWFCRACWVSLVAGL